jgi:hypothetical protein
MFQKVIDISAKKIRSASDAGTDFALVNVSSEVISSSCAKPSVYEFPSRQPINYRGEPEV